MRHGIPTLATALILLALPARGEEAKKSAAEKKADARALKLQELLVEAGASEKSAEDAASDYGEFLLTPESDQKKALAKLVEGFDFSTGGMGARKDALAHFQARGIREGSGGHATRDSILDAKNEFSKARTDNPAWYAKLIESEDEQNMLMKRHGIQPLDLDTTRPLVFGEKESLDLRRAELKLKPLMRKKGLSEDHAVWVLSEVRGLAALLLGEAKPEAKKEEKEEKDEKEEEERRPRWRR